MINCYSFSINYSLLHLRKAQPQHLLRHANRDKGSGVNLGNNGFEFVDLGSIDGAHDDSAFFSGIAARGFPLTGASPQLDIKGAN